MAEAVAGLINDVINAINSAFATAIGWVRDRVNEIVGGVNQAISGLSTWIQNVPDTVRGAFEGFKNWVANNITGFVSSVQELASWLWGMILHAGSVISEALKGAWDTLKEIPGNIANWIREKLGQIASDIKGAIESVIGGVRNWIDGIVSSLRGAWDSMKSKVEEWVDGLRQFGEKLIGDIKTAIDNFFTIYVAPLVNGFIWFFNAMAELGTIDFSEVLRDSFMKAVSLFSEVYKGVG